MFNPNEDRYLDVEVTFAGPLPLLPHRTDLHNETDALAALLKQAFQSANTPARVAVIDQDRDSPLKVTLEIPEGWYKGQTSTESDPIDSLKKQMNGALDGILMNNQPLPQVANCALA